MKAKKVSSPLQPSQRFKDNLFEASKSPKTLRPLRKLTAYDKNLVPTMVQNERNASPMDLKRLDTTRDQYNKRMMNKSAIKGIKKSPITLTAHKRMKTSLQSGIDTAIDGHKTVMLNSQLPPTTADTKFKSNWSPSNFNYKNEPID